MEISITKLTDVNLLREACEMTMRGSSKINLEQIYKCEHSPIRTQLFWVQMYAIPTFVSVHFVRHKVGVEHFVLTMREDRGGGQASRWTPVNHGMLINAQALIQMARKRLCRQSHLMTQKVMEEIEKAMVHVDVDLANSLVPECEYRNGYCPELKPCGR